MAKAKKPKSAKEIAFEKNICELQDFELPPNQPKTKRSYTRLTDYMLKHPNYRSLNFSAMIALQYMRNWAFKSEEYILTKKFEYSITMLANIGVMTAKTAKAAFNELEYYGFIKKENNACPSGGFTQKWSFSNEWYKSIKPKYNKH